MRIVSFSEGSLPEAGGVGIPSVPDIVRSLALRGHEVALLAGGNVILGAEGFVRTGIEQIFGEQAREPRMGTITYPSRGKWQFSPSLFLRAAPYMRDVDFVMLHSLYSFPVLTGYLLARSYNKPYGVWPHGVLAPFQRTISARKKAVYNAVITDHVLSHASVIFYTASGERAETDSLNLKPPSVVIPLGYDVAPYLTLPPRQEFRNKYLNGFTGLVILYLGRLALKKGLDILIEAFARATEQFPEAKLVLVGSADPPDFEASVHNWLAKSGVADRAVLTGRLTGSDKLSALAAADMFVLPSQAENFGFSMLDAMASRLPVVVSETLNLAAKVSEFGAGIVIPRDVESFANAMLELLRDPERRQQMGDCGWKLVNTYSWQRTGKNIEDTIHAILKGSSLPAELVQEHDGG